MTSTQTRERPPARKTGAKNAPEPGPPAPPVRKVGLRSLFPYLQGYWPTLGIVAVLSLVVTLLTLSQPVLTRDVLADIEADRPWGGWWPCSSASSWWWPCSAGSATTCSSGPPKGSC